MNNYVHCNFKNLYFYTTLLYPWVYQEQTNICRLDHCITAKLHLQFISVLYITENGLSSMIYILEMIDSPD